MSPAPDGSDDLSRALATLGEVVLVVTVDERGGVIRYAGGASEALLEWPAAEVTGQPLAVLIAERARGPLEGILRRLVDGAGEAPDASSLEVAQLPALTRSGSERPVELLLRRVAEQPRQLVASLRAIAHGPMLKQLLDERAQRQAAEAAERRLDVQYRVARTLVEAESAEDAIADVLRHFAEGFGWDVAAFWRWQEAERVLRCEATWRAGGVDAAALAAASRTETFRDGEGSVGGVFHTGRALLTEDATRDPRFIHAALFARDDIHGALLFPVGGARRIGVVGLYRRAAGVAPNEELSALAAVASQLGLYLEGRAAAERVRLSEEWLTTTLRSIGDAVITTGLDARVTYLNPEAERVTGWTSAEAIGRDVSEVVPLRDAEGRAARPAHDAMSEGQALALADDVVMVTRDGRIVDVDDSAAPIRDGAGHTIGSVLVLRDATARRRSIERRRFLDEASLLLGRSLDYRATLSSVAQLAVPNLADWCSVEVKAGDKLEQVALAHVDPSKVAWARELAERYPTPPDAPTGAAHVARTGASEIYPDIPDALLRAAAIDEEHLRISRELNMRSALIVPLVAHGQPLGALTLVSTSRERRYDSEDLAMAEELGRRAGQAIDNARLYREAQEAVRARDEFLSIASHELKTPLTSLQLQIQSLLIRARGDASATKLESANRQIVRLTRLINQLLDLSRVSVGQLTLDLEEVDLARVALDAIARLAEDAQRAGCTVVLKTPTDETGAPLAIVGRWDRLRLDQVVTNLVSNAMKYGPGKPVEVRLAVVGERARIEVRDEGMGVKEEDRARIFDRFERAVPSRHFGGLGLGLYIVRQIVQAHGGTVDVAPNEPSGSVFWVELKM